MATGRGSLEGDNGEVEMGRGATGMERKWQWGVGQRGGGDGEGSNWGRGGRWEVGNGEGERGKRWDGEGEKTEEEGRRRRGDFTDRYDGMPGWT